MASSGTIITIVLILCITIYLVVYRIYPGPDTKDVLSAPTPLQQKKNIVMPDRVQTDILGSGGTTVMGFFYLNQGDKTLRYGQADQYVPLLQVENNWSLEVAPSPKEKKEYGARLRVQTQQASQFQYETVPLPAIPKQKWVCIVILREGRRFDVIYDNRLVASQRLEHYPVVIASPLSVGGKGLEGTVIHMMVNNRRLSPEEVERERKAHVDTSGMVVEMKWNPLHSLEGPQLPLAPITAECPAGLPCDTVTSPPKKSLYEWKTPYA
jgi:hypothetical protein